MNYTIKHPVESRFGFNEVEDDDMSLSDDDDEEVDLLKDNGEEVAVQAYLLLDGGVGHRGKDYHKYEHWDNVMANIRDGVPISCVIMEQEQLLDGEVVHETKCYVALKSGFLNVIMRGGDIQEGSDTYWDLRLSFNEETIIPVFTDYCVFLPSRKFLHDDVSHYNFVAITKSWRNLTTDHLNNESCPVLA
jgi:hypothetical protein